MKFIRARSQKEIDDRQNEIIDACDALYSQAGYDGINFKAISELTSFSRPTVYNYFRTKEEILLALLKRELLRWRSSFLDRVEETKHMTKEQYCTCLTESLIAHAKMFRLLALLFSSLENNSRVENLADFHDSVSSVFDAVFRSTEKYFPHAAKEAKQKFQYEGVAYVLGLHAMISLSEKQIAAVQPDGCMVRLPDFKTLCYNGLLALLTEL